MATQSDFVEYLLELLSGFGKITARPMFGGYGIYRDDLIFGIVADDVFYLKTDETNRYYFASKNLKPFSYRKKGREYQMSYYEAPAEALEDSSILQEWAECGYAAALRSK